MRRILWPELDDEAKGQRWHKLCRDEIRRKDAKITVLMGCASSGKTHEAAWNYLCEYYCFPDETLVLVSSTDIRGLELRVWGEIKSLHDRARERFDFIPGEIIESKHAISTDIIGTDEVRDLRKGVVGIPTVQGGRNIGLGKWVGVKQKRMRLVADEAQFMSSSFLSAFSNLNNNEDFQAIVLGNAIDILDPLGCAAEPLDGWSSHLEPAKTECWDTKFMNGRCINLIGTDSPNFDFPGTRFKYLISAEKIESTVSFFTKESMEYYSQCVGSMKIGLMANRVITRDMCKRFDACGIPAWKGDDSHTKIVSLDAAYNGDRCVLTESEMGMGADNKHLLWVVNQLIVPISVSEELSPEDQIAVYCRDYCVERGIPPQNFFHDSTGRGTLGTALARVWSALCNPVEFGGSPTKRPVSNDLYIVDEKTKQKRHKRCDEHFSKFVSELWWMVRLIIESQQLKGLPVDTMEEGCLRQWSMVAGNKVEVESKKEMKERIRRSPDLFDSLVISVEGARRLGFRVAKMALVSNDPPQSNWVKKEAKSVQKMQKKRVLQTV